MNCWQLKHCCFCSRSILLFTWFFMHCWHCCCCSSSIPYCLLDFSCTVDSGNIAVAVRGLTVIYWVFHALLTVETLLLLFGVYLCFTVRKAPVYFNESKYITWSTYNAIVLGFFIITLTWVRLLLLLFTPSFWWGCGGGGEYMRDCPIMGVLPQEIWNESQFTN